MTRLPATLPLFLLASQISSSEAGVVANYSDATNLRFEDDPSFIGAPFDLSGVGRLSQLSPSDQNRVANGMTALREGTWATALGSNYFLSANHYQPDAGSEITFRGGNSLSSPSFTYEVGGGFRVGTTDLWIGYTNAEIDSSIARYGYSTTPANSLGDLALGDQTLYMSGDNLSGRPGTVTDHVLGTNQAESFYNEGSGQFLTPGTTVEFTPPSGFENDMIILIEDLPGDDATPLTHESLVTGGDSGSPLFSASGSTLTVLGVGSLASIIGPMNPGIPGNFIADGNPNDLERRQGSFYSYTGSYESEIAAAIAQVPAPIPEPTTGLTLAFGVLLAIRRKR